MAQPADRQTGQISGPATEQLARSYAELLERPSEPAHPLAEAIPLTGEPSAPPPVHRILEALFFVGGPAMTAERASDAIRGLTPSNFLQAIETLNRDYRAQGRPYRIRPREDGFELVLQPTFRIVQERLYGFAREARLSPMALDVLALVAYRQPVTKSEVDSLRGADSASPLRQLVRVGLIAVQRGESGQKEVSYNTTPRFLTLFGLANLDDLPRTQDPERM